MDKLTAKLIILVEKWMAENGCVIPVAIFDYDEKSPPQMLMAEGGFNDSGQAEFVEAIRWRLHGAKQVIIAIEFLKGQTRKAGSIEVTDVESRVMVVQSESVTGERRRYEAVISDNYLSTWVEKTFVEDRFSGMLLGKTPQETTGS